MIRGGVAAVLLGSSLGGSVIGKAPWRSTVALGVLGCLVLGCGGDPPSETPSLLPDVGPKWSPLIRWSESFHGNFNVGLLDIAMSPSGHTIVAGTGGPELGGQSIYLWSNYMAHYSPRGELQQVQVFDNSEPERVSFDRDDGYMVEGSKHGPDDYGSGGLGGTGAFFARYDARAQLSYVTVVDGFTPLAIGDTPDGGALWIGRYFPSTDLGSGPLGGTKLSLFASRLDREGRTVWTKTYSATDGFVFGSDAAIDTEGGFAVAGHFTGSVDFGLGSLTSLGAEDLFLVRFDAQAQPVFSKHFGTPESELGPSAVAFHPSGDLAYAVTSGTPIELGRNPQRLAYGVAVARFSPAGEELWSWRFASDTTSWVTDVVSVAERTVITGASVLAESVAGEVLESGGGQNLCLAAFDTEGRIVMARAFGVGWYDCVRLAAAGGQDEQFALGGGYTNLVQIGGSRYDTGGIDAFAVKFGFE